MNSSIVPVKSSISIEEGRSFSLVAKAFGANSQTLTYEWNFGDGSASVQGATVIHRYHLAGRYPLTLIVRDDKGTVSIVERTVAVEMLPLVITALTSEIIDEAKGIVAFEAIATIPSNDPANQIANQVASKIASEIASQASATVPLNEGTANASTGDLVTSDQAISRLVSYVWNFGDGGTPASGQKAVHKFNQSGIYHVSVIASSPSGSTAAQVHEITLDGVISDSPIKGNKEVLKDYPVTFNSPFTNGDILKTHRVRWNFGDGTIVEDKLAPEHAYQKLGSYTVSLAITDEQGRTTTSKIPVEVVSATLKILSLSAEVASEDKNATDLVAIIDNPDNQALTYAWDFGDGNNKTYQEPADARGNKGRNVSHVYAAEGTYRVMLAVSNKTGSRAVETISVDIESIPQIESIAYPSSFVKGKSAVFGAMATSRRKDELVYQWYFQNADKNASQNDGQENGQTVSFTFLGTGAWSVVLMVVDGYKRAVEAFDIFVEAKELMVGIEAESNVLVGRSAQFRGYLNDGDSGEVHNLRTVEWNFGDGTIVESQGLDVSHRYRTQGSYTLTLSVSDERGITATDFVAVSVVDSPLILVAGGKVLFNGVKGIETAYWLNSVNDVYFYSGEALRAEGDSLVAIPEVSLAVPDVSKSEISPVNINTVDASRLDLATVEAIAILPDKAELETISLVEADDSVQYQQIDTISVEVPQHHDLVSDVLLQTSLMGYDPIRLDVRAYRNQLKTVAGWSDLFPVGESARCPSVIEIERGPLIILGGVILKNIVIVVKRGDIVFRGDDHSASGVTLIAQNGEVTLGNLKATAIKVFSSKTIRTTAGARFQSDSILASQQLIEFNGATVGAGDCLTIISQQKVRFNASELTRSQILANSDVELCQGTALQGSIRTRRNVIFNAATTLSAALSTPVVESYKTLTVLEAEPDTDLAINLNIRPPADIDGAQPTIRVVETPPDVKGFFQLADGTRLFSGKQLTSAELAEVSFYPTSGSTEETYRFIYAIEDSWNIPIKQTISIRFRTSLPTTSPVFSPVQSLMAQPPTLWPPAHQMVGVEIEGFEQFGPGFTVTLDSVTCSEPIGAKGDGDGDYDYEIITDGRVFLRAAQPRNQVNRLYRLLYRIADTLGNVTYSKLDIPVTLSADIYVIEPR